MVDRPVPPDQSERGVIERLRSAKARAERGVVGRLSVRQLSAIPATLIGLTLFVMPAAAQSVEDVGTVICDSPLGTIVGLVFITFSLVLLVKAVFIGMTGLDKMKSTSSSTTKEGEEQIVSAGYTAAAAFIPSLATGLFEVLGVNMVGCMAPENWSIVGTIVVSFPA